MRDYGKVSPLFWTGKTGRSLRKDPEAQLTALYLMTSQHANMLGLYYCPVAYIVADTGISHEGACKALQRLSEALFCTYDADTEWVFVHEMARFQIADQLKASDKQVFGVRNELSRIPNIGIKKDFIERYRTAFHLDPPKTPSPIEGPSKPLRSQEQEQEQEQEQKKKKRVGAEAPAATAIPDWLSASAWKTYVDHRRAIRKPMTGRATELAIAKLEALRHEGHDPAKVIDLCVMSGWTGLIAKPETLYDRPQLAVVGGTSLTGRASL